MAEILNKTAAYSVYLIAFLLPWQTRLLLKTGEINGGYSEYLTYSLYAIDILIVIALFLNLSVWFCFGSYKNQALKFDYWIPIGFLEFIIFLSIFFADNKWLASYHYLIFLEGIIVFWIVGLRHVERRKLMLFFLSGVMIVSCLALFQFTIQSTPGSKWLGLAPHNPVNAGVSVVASGENRWLRAYGSLDHPNMLGGFLAIAVLLAIREIFRVDGKLFVNENSFYVFTLVAVSALFFSFSRAAWLGLLIGLGIALFLFILRRDENRKKYLTVLAFVSVIGLLWGLAYHDLALTRLENSGRLESKSVNERFLSWQSAVDVVEDNFFLGVGYGNYVFESVKIHPDEESWYYQPAHNVYLLAVAELGILGLLSFIAVFICVITVVIKRIGNNRSFFNISIIASLLVMFLFDHWWWSLHFGVIFLWFTIGILVKEDEKLII